MGLEYFTLKTGPLDVCGRLVGVAPGKGGELRVEERRVNWEILDAWRDAAEECGIPKIEEFNRGDNFGNAYFQVNQRRGVRWSGTRAFLRPSTRLRRRETRWRHVGSLPRA